SATARQSLAQPRLEENPPMTPSNPLRPPPPARGQCEFSGARGQCQNPGRWDRDGFLSCTTHLNAHNPTPYRSLARRSTEAQVSPTVVPPPRPNPSSNTSARPRPDTTLPDSSALRLSRSSDVWWQKPLVAF